MIINDVTYSDQTSQSAERGNEIGRDEFLKLLIAQLSYQDPLSPVESTEFTAQLSRFSQLEQMVNLNEKLDDLLLYQSSINSWQGVGMIDKEVDALSDRVELKEGVPGKIGYHLENDCARVTVQVFDASGKLVRTLDEGARSKGEYLIEWDGKSESGTAMPDGRYTVTVTAGEEGDSDGVTTFIRGVVTGVSFEETIPLLLIGHEKIPFASVMQIRSAAQG